MTIELYTEVVRCCLNCLNYLAMHVLAKPAMTRRLGDLASQVHVSETATDRVPNSSPTAASCSTDLYGMAALDACEQIIERLRPVVSAMPPDSPFASIVTVRGRSATSGHNCNKMQPLWDVPRLHFNELYL